MPASHADISSPDESPTFGKDGHFEVNKPVGSMSISPCGRDVVLASRHGLHIIDLDSPWSPPRHLAHHTPWEVADVQWSPFPSKDHWVVSTSNQKALVWNLEMSTRHDPIEFTLHGHSRALTDIQFSAHDPNALASCAVDSFVHCWDLRTPQRPAYSFCDWFAGATQTKWNRLNPHIIASSHDRTLHIWDNRKGAYPLRSLDAHDTKIYGIDWDRTSAHKIITCSLDKSVKFWDYSVDSNRPERLLRTPFPIWRARHTPFGHGIMAMPQRGDFNLHLYDCREESIGDRDPDRSPKVVGKFSGHEDNVKEFLWRPRGCWQEDSDNREFQLVTWGADRILRLHHLNDDMLQQVGFQRGQPGNFTTRKNARYRTFRVAGADLPTHPTEGVLLAGIDRLDSLTAKAAPMSTSPLAGPLGWADAGFLNTQPGIRAKAPPRREVDPIAWMKGVRIGKHDSKERHHPGTASLPTLSIDNWEQFENLGEEVKHVGQTFTKVEFDGSDINKRFLTMSLYAPWGKDRSQVFMSCRMQFPAKYPTEAAEFVLEDRTTLSPEDTEEIKTTAAAITAEFSQRGKPSVEAIVRFLHRERTLDDLVGWLKQGLSTPNILPTAIDEESSSDEEEELGRLPAQLDDLRLAGSDVLVNSNANATMPLPGQCGARWSRDGRLVCFFRPKLEKAGSVTGLFDGQSGFSGKKQRYYDGFGRVDLPRDLARSRASSQGSLDSDQVSVDSASDSSDSSSTNGSSLEDEFSDRPKTTSQSFMNSSLIVRALGPKSHDGMQGSQTSKKPTMPYIREKRSIVSIKAFPDLIPAERELASYQYQGLDLGQANAELALLYGSSELADAWSMASNLCQWHESTIPGTKIETTNVSESLGQLGAVPGHFAQPIFNSLAASLSDSSTAVRMSIALGLFDYFGRRSDVQMAATLACAFQPFITPVKSEKLHHSVRASSHAKPISGFKASGLNTIRSALDMRIVEPEPQAASDPIRIARVDSDDMLLQPPSLASSLGAEDPQRQTSLSTGNTPPSRRIPKAHELRKENSFSQLKPSPTSRLWQLESAAGGIIAGAGNFANAISQNFSFSASSSPPTKKWPSPSMSFTTARSNLTRPSATTPGASMIAERRQWSIPDEYAEVEDAKKHSSVSQLKRRRYKVTYKREEATKANPASTFMTSNEQQQLYAIFDLQRCAYADLLTVWGLPIARAEVLKHNTTPGTERNVAEQPSEKAPLELGKRTADANKKPGLPPGLLARRLCPFCSATNWLERRNSAFRCQTCNWRVPPLACVFCNKLMRGRTYPCFNCGHVMHARCRTRLATETGYDGRCIEGCDCACPSAVVVQVPKALNDSTLNEGRHVRVGSTETTDSRVTEIKLEVPRGVDGEVVRDEDSRSGHGLAWEEMAKESLARNLGGLGATRRARSSDGRATGARDRAFRPQHGHQKQRREGIGAQGES